MSHGVHASSRSNKDTMATVPTTATASTTVTTMTTIAASSPSCSSAVSQPVFVRPFEDSFRSSSKPQQRPPLVNSHNHSITSQLSHPTESPSVKSSTAQISQTIGQVALDGTETAKNVVVGHQQSSMSQQQQPPPPPSIPYPPQQFHHPHIPVSHVPGLYKPPHFPSASSHQQHHSQQGKINVPSLASNGSGGGGVVTGSNCARQSSHHPAGESNPLAATTMASSQRSENNANCVAEKTAAPVSLSYNGSSNSSGNSVAPGSKISCHSHQKSNGDNNGHQAAATPKLDAKANAAYCEKMIEKPANQLATGQNHSGKNHSIEKPSVPHSTCYDQGKGTPIFQPQEVFAPIAEKEIKPEIVVVDRAINPSTTDLTCNNVLSTLSFQPSFKFSVNEIAPPKPPPIDAAQLMHSIKSEEVLRTCQNVSNVLLQIPKYQEKLLNFSNELKNIITANTTASIVTTTSNNVNNTNTVVNTTATTATTTATTAAAAAAAFCFTDKCNNLTEISVKCEPPVLNVPDLSKALVKQDVAVQPPCDKPVLLSTSSSSSSSSFLVPEKPKELTSSLDLAERRRKRKRERNASLVCSSDSEGEEEIKDVDLWITKGPPAKLQYSDQKLAFLAMFGLTTLSTRNEMELCKVEKRYKLNPDPPDLPSEGEQFVESVLPIPRDHPDALLHTADFEPKVGFLKTIGLDLMPPSRRDEAEVTWQYVLQDRKKRKSTNTVTAYCERIAKAYSMNPPALPKPPQKMRLLDRVKVKHVPERPPPLPPLVPNIVPMCYPVLPVPGENGVKQHCKVVDVKIIDDDDENVAGKRARPKWNGIEDILLAYREYSKEKTLEKRILTSETSRLAAQSNGLRSETIQLERRIYELLSAKTALDSERRVLGEKIERINALVRNLR